ncbi:tail fiber assembly protein [Photorhabdus heterorhabditis]|nr:tail fiber assembly protein [Photorhabdus heterorhabditis]
MQKRKHSWEKYQISLSRIDVTSAPDINWPKRPQ